MNPTVLPVKDTRPIGSMPTNRHVVLDVGNGAVPVGESGKLL